MSANPSIGLPRPDEIAPGEHYWVKASRDLRHRLNQAVPHEALKELHRKSPVLHVSIAIRQFALLAFASVAAWKFPQPWIWIPAALVSGWTVFNFTVLLHEAVHHAIFNGPHPRGDRALALLYAVPSGISALQFTRWHLTHHAELGDANADPKRHYLSPRINRAWFKLLYFTPALFPIYFRAAKKETSTYPPDLRRTIGLGAMSPEEALNYGLSGPMLRASGVAFDDRSDEECHETALFEPKPAMIALRGELWSSVPA
jgi:hypothetical protein